MPTAFEYRGEQLLSGSSSQTWNPVRDMVRAVQEQHENMRESFDRSLYYWEFVIRQFRDIEDQQMYLKEPEPIDYHFHRMYLSQLISQGEGIVILAKTEPVLLKDKNVTIADIEAQLRALSYSYEEWHSLNEPAGDPELEAKIFVA